ncbi:DEAD/DEAH box helicase family protein [Methanolobus bombayensis]|uniref:DEAD/DEAH box helicase family protein n=1 Tax=Methanolobus bombayensis TaxID=38023 RepID=UPI001AEB35D0|nr:DEAD/DEAH box helicase family protein [Methanolobus bombayensis]MBP1908450.1 type I restriction enzyme R subunit [Methanolobus bombayensis]
MGYNEADTRAKLIDPQLHLIGWKEDLIRRETTAGAVEIINGKTKRKSGKADYLLCLPAAKGESPLPVAVIEAKKEDEFADLGIDQAKEYAKYLHVPFVFSTNGHLFVSYDAFSKQFSKELPLDKFPTPEFLKSHYECGKGLSLDDDASKPLLVPYKGGQSERRYYQDAAIRATFEKIASKQDKWNRVLLSLATGSGKTRIASQILYKLAETGQLRKALFVCDRNELRKQGFGRMFAVFGDNADFVENKDPKKNARIIVSTYQALGIDDEGDESFFLEHFPKNYFSHIIIDECHRSAWNKWSIVLKNNPDAVQIGLTATPRQISGGSSDERGKDEEISQNNIEYFGEPVYEYPYHKGWEDGYLAACEIVKRQPDIDGRILSGQEIIDMGARDAKTGNLLTIHDTREAYGKKNYERDLILPDRVKAMCKDLMNMFEETGGLKQKTIIFCVNDKHAGDVANTLNNLYVERRLPECEKFAFKCTQKGISAGTLGESQEVLIANMRGSQNSHFIATTVDLLTTGVDIPCIQNIVFFSYVNSPIQFYQMVGRGTRIDEGFNKYMFRLYDYTNVTRLFGEEFISNPRSAPSKPSKKGASDKRKIAKVQGYEVEIKDEGTFILMRDDATGKEKPVTIEEYKEQLAASLVDQARDIDLLREMWINPEDRKHLVSALPGGNQGAYLLRELLELDDCDLFDLFAEIGFGVPAKTRDERVEAFDYKNKDWLMSLPSDSSEVIKALADQFRENGIEELERKDVFNVPSVKVAGGIRALGKIGVRVSTLISDVKEKLLAA